MKFDQKYSRNEFIKFLGNFLPEDFLQREEDIVLKKERCKKIHKAQVLGACESIGLQVLEMEHESMSDPRVSIATDAFKILADHWIHRALVIFKNAKSDNYRLSLLTISLDLNEKNKTVRKYSNARRYSFYLGPGAKVNTPIKYLIKNGGVKNFEDLKDRFSLEVVNKEFYREIAHLFARLVGGSFGNGKNQKEYEPLLGLPSVTPKSQQSLEFGVRLIGRVIFCWFLREKKSDAGVSLMPHKLLSHTTAKEQSNYYHKILEPIFFEVLNKPVKSRKDQFSDSVFALIPYLNGGLFTPQQDDFYAYNENKQSIYNNTVKVPDEWIRDLFEFLETYNFTIDENISFDEELSIDPEMLGRIFENLLAEINPETGESARKSTGSYYTPRIIVDYMVNESIFSYLKRKTGIAEENLRAVVSYDLLDDQRHPITKEEKKEIVSALSEVKILDPASGSGAFPIGSLQKIVFILQQVDPNGQEWFKQQIKNTSPEIKRVIEREFEDKNFDYIRKLGVIRENIFGVDIQPIATEISRLRCFLTLIVDESIRDNSENRGIEPLPNLDFKFVTANSLVGLPGSSEEVSGQGGLFEDRSGIEELQELRNEFFTAAGTERERIKLQFVQAQNRIFQRLIQAGSTKVAELTTKLTSWDPFSHESSSWFDPGWMFGIKKGFDIVIGNPPYNAKLTDAQRKFYKENYKSVSRGRQDTAAIFFEAAVKILKPRGALSYILPYRLLSRKRNHGEFQSFALSNSDIIQILYLGSGVGFSANDEFMILLASKGTTQENEIKIYFKPNLEKIEKAKTIKQSVFRNSNEINLNLLRYDQNLLHKIEVGTLPMGEICFVRDGIVPYLRDKLISKTKLDDRYVRFAGIAGTYELKKYFFRTDELYLCYDIDEAKKYIKDPVELRKVQLRDRDIFLQRKILSAQNSSVLKGAIDEKKTFVSNSIHSTYLKKEYSDEYRLEYILGILNSKLMNYYHNSLRTKATDLHPQILVTNLKKLPIKKISKDEQDLLVDNVSSILEITSQPHYSPKTPTQKQVELERKIDDLVYKLYGITKADIQIIEESTT